MKDERKQHGSALILASKSALVCTVLLMMMALTQACEKKDTNKRYEKIAGTWMLYAEDDQPLKPEDIQIFTLSKNGEIAVSKYYRSDNNFINKWMDQRSSGTYTLRGKHFKAKLKHNNRVEVIAKITEVKGDTINYMVKRKNVNSINQMIWRKPFKHTLVRVENTDSLLRGSWTYYDKQTSTRYCLVFKENHQFDFYQSIDDQWEAKKDNQGTWYAYGNFFCLNYFNDLFNPDRIFKESSFCTFYEIKDDTLRFEAEDFFKDADFVKSNWEDKED